MSEEEDWEHPYPEGSLGWKINRKIDAIVRHPFKSGAVFMILFAAFFTPAAIELTLYFTSFPNPSSPFFDWQIAVGNPLNLARWNMTLYFVTLLMFAGAFFYIGARLIWRGLKTRKS
jgi:hypothetical protein